MPVNQRSERTGNSRNHLLAALPAATMERIGEHLRPAVFPPLTVVGRPDDAAREVYFLESGLCALVTPMRDGAGVECAAVGPEGLLGVGLALAGQPLPVETVTQTEVEALQLPAGVFRRELARDAALRETVHVYAHALVVQVLQGAACNRLHSLEARTCRWLLMAQDRVGSDRIAVTQERLASALGVRRPSVTVIANDLQRAGLIAYRRGHVQIVNRQGLESAACECYAAIQRHLPPHARPSTPEEPAASS